MISLILLLVDFSVILFINFSSNLSVLDKHLNRLCFYYFFDSIFHSSNFLRNCLNNQASGWLVGWLVSCCLFGNFIL